MSSKVLTIPSAVYSLPGIKVHGYNEHDLVKDVADYFKITPAVIKSKGRERTKLVPRQICMYFLVEKFPQYTFQGIGYMMGGFNHATVCHSRDTIANDMRTNVAFREMIEEIRVIIESHIFSISTTSNAMQSIDKSSENL